MTSIGRVLSMLLLAIGACTTDRVPGGDVALRVGSKAFTESVIVADIAVQQARLAGTPAVHRRSLGGTRLVWNALLSGEIDVYPDYTGTLFQEILRIPPGSTDSLATALAGKRVGLIGPLGFDDTYALAVTELVGHRLGLRTISDLAQHPDLRLGFSSEFLDRRDGWPGVREAYGLRHGSVRGLDHDLAYRGLVAGDLDVVDVYTTDAEIAQHRLRVLQDDRSFFPRYDAVLVHRLDVDGRFPAAVAALRQLAGAVNEQQMREMNGRVRLGRQPETAVAAAFVQARFGHSMQDRQPGRWRVMGRRLVEHVQLVGLSLLAAIALAVPLGIVAWRHPRVGQIVLGAVGIVQTIPSLALLVFMVPLLGLGATPAIVALFLYGLLPIVRNTHAGLAAVPPELRESAAALGLPARAALRLVELPLASGAVLAGIKSAAVINVGTATLGALVGAGGFGQPIFTGVRLDDAAMILEGAIPASLLALAVQGMFEGIERVLVPRGASRARADG